MGKLHKWGNRFINTTNTKRIRINHKLLISISLLLLAFLVASLLRMVTTAQQTVTVTTYIDIAWPYVLPYSFNYWATNFLSAGIWQDLVTPPLAQYIWYNNTWIPILASNWTLQYFPNGTGLFIIHLIKNNGWSDGTPFTAQDVKCTFLIDYAFNYPAFLYISPQIDTPDNYTVVLHIVHPASPIVLEWDILYLMPPQPYKVYGNWCMAIQNLINQGYSNTSPQMTNLTQAFVKWNPPVYLADGPYYVDTATITTDTYWLVKNPYSAWANQVKFDALKNHNGETPVITPVVLAKEVDYATHGFPPASAAQFQSIGYSIASPPTLFGPALFFNYNDSTYGPLFRNVIFRQAIAYAINMTEAAQVSLGPYAKVEVPWQFTGVPESIAESWIEPWAIGQISSYTYNPSKAAQLLESIGLKKVGNQWYWNGKPVELTLIYPAEFADWGATAQNIAAQLTAFGIKIDLKAVTYSEVPTLVEDGQFQLAIQGWGAGAPTPFFSYYNLFATYNAREYLGTGTPGMALPMIWNTTNGLINASKLIYEIGYSTNVTEEREAFSKLAIAFSQYLPVIPIWERYGDNPVLEGVRVCGWLPFSNPLWKNPVYQNNPVVLQVLFGILYPCPSYHWSSITLPVSMSMVSPTTTTTSPTTTTPTTTTAPPTTTTTVTSKMLSTTLIITVVVVVIIIAVVAVVFLMRRR
ncbi:MAG: ABC transporter substrate-binding protein [Caldivirga sp.]